MTLPITLLLFTLSAVYADDPVPPRSKQCDNMFVATGEIDDFLCSTNNTIPNGVLNITFGPTSVICRGVACAYRAMGCVPEAERVEKRIKDAGGVVVAKCDKNFGIDASLCDIASRVVYNPSQPDFTSPQTIAATASVCSPLVAQLAQYLPQLKPFANKFGPCGEFCRDAACGLNILCSKQAASVITFINSQLSTCAANVTTLNCASLDGDDNGGTSNTEQSATPAMTVATTLSKSAGADPTPGSTPDVAVAGISLTPADYAKCASLSGTSCRQCTEDNAICIWCESTKNCNATTTAWLGPSPNWKDDLFPSTENGVCPDWQYGQCMLSGRMALMLPVFIALGIILLCCICIAVCCCCCLCNKSKNNRRGYKLAKGSINDGDDVALLADSQETQA